MKELEHLKGTDALGRPGSSSGEVTKLRQERDHLFEENRKLQQVLTEESAGPTSGNVKYLKQKVNSTDLRYSILRKNSLKLKKRGQALASRQQWLKNS